MRRKPPPRSRTSAADVASISLQRATSSSLVAGNAARGAVVVLHALLDAEVVGVFVAVAEHACQLALVVEQQAFLGTTGQQVQGIADTEQSGLRRRQCLGLGGIKQAGLDHLRGIARAGDLASKPADQLQVAQGRPGPSLSCGSRL